MRKPQKSFPPQADLPEQGMHLLDYLGILLRRKWVVVISFCSIATLIAVHTLLSIPIYQAVCTMRIYKEPPKIVKFDETLPTRVMGEDAFIKSEIEIIKSRSMAVKVVRSLNLDLHPEFTGVNPSPSIWNLFSLLNKKPGELKKEETKGSPDAVANAFIGRITVQPQPPTQIVRIKAWAEDPGLSALMANTLAEEYFRYTMESKVLMGTSASGELAKQLSELKKKLEGSERALYEYAKANEMVALGETESLLKKKIDELNGHLSRVSAERIKAETLYVQSGSLNPGYLPAILASSVVQNLETKYSDTNSEYLRELERVQSEHPSAKQLKAKMEAIAKALELEKQKIAQGIKEEYVEVVEREKGFRQQMEDLLAQKGNLEGKLVQYRTLKRDADTNAQLYDALLQRMKETTVASEIKAPNVTIVDRALVPGRHYKPNRKKDLSLGAIFGLFFGVGLAFLIEYLDTSVKGQEDIERTIGITFLGAIPNLVHGKKRGYY